MKKLTKRILAVTATAAMAVGMCASFTACKKERGENEILIWAGGQWTGSDADNLKAFEKWYNKNNTIGLTIEIKPQTDFEKTFSAAIADGTGPDMMVWDRFNTPTYASTLNLEPLTDLIERDGIDASKFNATAYQEMGYNGEQYGLPLDLDLWGIYVNMDIVDAYNNANPSSKITCFWQEDGTTPKYDWSWDDVLDTGKKLKDFEYELRGKKIKVANGYDGKNVNEFFIHNYYSTGADFLVDGKASCNNEQGIATLQYLYELRRTGSDAYNEEMGFIGGYTAMYMRPTYFTSYLSLYGGNMNVRFMPQPKSTVEGGKNRGVMGGYGMAIPCPIYESDRTDAWLKKKERCWDFMKDWLYNEEYMRKWAEMSKTIPALTSTHTSTEVQSNTMLKDLIPFAADYTIRPGVPGWTAVQVNVFNTYVSTFVKGNKNDLNTIKDALKTIEEQTDYTLASYGKI